MRILVISDIHANLTALDAVLSDAGSYDAVWCLGDIIGYGPDPNECVERVKNLPNLTCLLGNHDAAGIGQLDISTFNPEARLSIMWVQQILKPDNRDFLLMLPDKMVEEGVTLAHGSPRSPIFEYLLDTQLATENFYYFDTDICLVGHTHLPVQYIMMNGTRYADFVIPKPGVAYEVQPRSIINPGSVGQPRDRDPRAAYAIFDTETYVWDYRRVKYDIRDVQKRMIEVELPERHVKRLESGW